MYTKKRFPMKRVFAWTWQSLLLFLVISVIPVVFYTFFDFHFLSLPWLPLAVLGTSVGFIMGFKNNKCYDRIWEARKIWGGIINASRSIGIMINDFIGNEHVRNKANLQNASQLKATKRTMINRHIAWLTALRYSLREPKPWEVALAQRSNAVFMKNNPIPEHLNPIEKILAFYLSEDDLTYVMSKTNKAAAILNLQSRHLEELSQTQLIWRFSYLEMKKKIVDLITLQGKNERIKNFPYPRQFATLNFWLVWIFIFLIPFGVMGPFHEMGLKLVDYYKAEGVSEGFPMFMAHNFIWLSVPFCTVISWVFNTIERVGEVSENPFEGTANDIPITTISKAIEIDLLEIIDSDPEQIPKPLAPVMDIMM